MTESQGSKFIFGIAVGIVASLAIYYVSTGLFGCGVGPLPAPTPTPTQPPSMVKIHTITFSLDADGTLKIAPYHLEGVLKTHIVQFVNQTGANVTVDFGQETPFWVYKFSLAPSGQDSTQELAVNVDPPAEEPGYKDYEYTTEPAPSTDQSPKIRVGPRTVIE
jgi:hypothetical protein